MDSELFVTPKNPWFFPLKTVAECLSAVIILLPALPMMLVAAICIKCTSRGPVFYRQTRVGKNGRNFRLIKLRTMVHNAEALTGAVWATTNDSRVTRVGRFLRNYHIDEFPQLLQVLCGQMSLIGPRPERPEFVSSLQQELPNYHNRLKVKPGITGLAQLKLPPDSDLESVKEKLVHDLYYVRYASPWLDLRIALSTAGYLLSMLWRIPWTMFGLPTREAVECGVEALLDVDLQPTTSAEQVQA